MLYDPKWGKKVEPTLAGFAAWLETKDPTEKYSWTSCDCAIGQYAQHLGSRLADLSFAQYEALDGGWDGHVASGRPRTFGAALERARAALASRG